MFQIILKIMNKFIKKIICINQTNIIIKIFKRAYGKQLFFYIKNQFSTKNLLLKNNIYNNKKK